MKRLPRIKRRRGSGYWVALLMADAFVTKREEERGESFDNEATLFIDDQP